MIRYPLIEVVLPLNDQYSVLDLMKQYESTPYAAVFLNKSGRVRKPAADIRAWSGEALLWQHSRLVPVGDLSEVSQNQCGSL